MKLVIVVQHSLDLFQAPRWFTERLRAEFPQLEVVQRNSFAGIEAELTDSDVLVAWSLRPEQLAAARKLRWIHSPAAAVHGLMSPQLVASDIVVTNAREVHGAVVAEHAIALVLALGHRLPSAMRWQEKRIWAQGEMWHEHPKPGEVAGRTLGLLGVGSIGREVVRRADALGMRIFAIRHNPGRGLEAPTSAANHVVAGPEQLHCMLAESDYVVLAAPVTPETHEIINAATLAHMRAEAYLVNVSRGALVNEAALVSVLRDRKIAGAALDVFVEEPLPPESPFWTLDNVLITPHTAGLSEHMWERHYSLLSENLRRFFAGRKLLGLVDKSRGY